MTSAERNALIDEMNALPTYKQDMLIARMTLKASGLAGKPNGQWTPADLENFKATQKRILSLDSGEFKVWYFETYLEAKNNPKDSSF